jgi:hypothetical protein
MAIFNRYTQVATPQDDAEAELKAIAAQRLAATTPAPAPVKAPTAIALPPVKAPLVAPTLAPAKTLAPPPIVQPAPVKPTSPVSIPTLPAPIKPPTTGIKPPSSIAIPTIPTKDPVKPASPIALPAIPGTPKPTLTNGTDGLSDFQKDNLATNDAAGGASTNVVTNPAGIHDFRAEAIDAAKAKAAARDDDDDLDAVARSRVDQQEQDAARADLAAGKAKALMMANARAQLGGMGLSGATAALEGDIGRTQDRGATLTMAELQRRQRDEGRADKGLAIDEKRANAADLRSDADAKFLEIQRRIAINQLEEDTGEDQDGDDKINGETEEDRRRREALEKKAAERDTADDSKRAQMSGDGSDFNPYTGTVEDAEGLRDSGVEFKSNDTRVEESGDGKFYIVSRGTDGKLYKFAVSEKTARNAGWGTTSDTREIGASILQSLGLA